MSVRECSNVCARARAFVCGVAWRGVSGVAWRGVAWCGVVWCGVVWCGVVCVGGVVWCVRLCFCVRVCAEASQFVLAWLPRHEQRPALAREIGCAATKVRTILRELHMIYGRLPCGAATVAMCGA